MSERFVDLTYRGLALANRVRLADVPPPSLGGSSGPFTPPDAGFLEMAAPMPVGTTLTLETDDGVSFEVTVLAVREQATPGMVVTPDASPAAQLWWGGHVGSIDVAPPVEVVRPKRRDDEASKLVDDGRKTSVMAVAQPIPDDAEASSPDLVVSSANSVSKRRRKRRRR